jgi:hypothetical protein
MSLGFSDQSLFTRHFQRLLGVTPGQFRVPARTAEQVASPAKKLQSEPLTIPQGQRVGARVQTSGVGRPIRIWRLTVARLRNAVRAGRLFPHA